jgi:hypothetical protein
MVNVQAELEHDGSPGVHLCFQKQLAVLQKQLWILEVRSVPGVGIDDQLRVGDMLRHDPRVDRRAMMSLEPFTTRVGCWITRNSTKRSPLI